MKTLTLRKKLLTVLLALCCSLISVTSASATEIAPMTEGTEDVKALLTINSAGQASCTITVNARSASYHIEVTMSLNQIGKSTPLKSWPLSGNGVLSATKTYYIVKGHDYQVTATITVRDSGGRLIESFTTKSSIVHY